MHRRGQTDDAWDNGDQDWDADDCDDEDLEVDDDEPTIACPHCRRQIHEDAQRCPFCEHYLSEEDRYPSSHPWWVVVGALLGLGAVVSWFVF